MNALIEVNTQREVTERNRTCALYDCSASPRADCVQSVPPPFPFPAGARATRLVELAVAG